MFLALVSSRGVVLASNGILDAKAKMSNPLSVLVTGGAGYIGSHCCKALSESGFTPVCYDNLSTGHHDFVKWGPFVAGDVRDGAKVTEAIRGHAVVAVMHFAAASLVGESVVDPQKYYLNNVVGTVSLLQAMRDAGCSRFVLSSTGAVYGNAANRLISETDRCEPINPYGSSKWMVEQILSDYRQAYAFNSFCLRYFNASGADASGVIGELRDPETHLIPRAMMALQGYAPDFSIFGDDYDTPDGTAIRDYIHVTDLAAAHVLALGLLLQGHAGGSFNLGTGNGFSVREILAAIAAETGRPVPQAIKPRRSGDPAMLVADPQRARDVLKFQARHSDLPTIVRTAWAWHLHAHPVRNVP
jgi:UDP-glucose 4-epimerase